MASVSKIKAVKQFVLFRHLHVLLLPLVSHRFSNKFVSDFQSFCGLRADGNVQNKPLYFFFKTASLTGEEIFALLPILYWFAIPLGFPLGTNFGFILTIGQITKDLLLLPRPPVVSVCLSADLIFNIL